MLWYTCIIIRWDGKSSLWKNTCYLLHKKWMWNPTWITSLPLLHFPPFLPIFHSIGPFVSISFAQRLFCFRVIWWSYFPLIIFSHFKPILSLDIYYDYNCTLSLPQIYSLVLTQTTWPACILTFTSGSKTIVNWTDIYIDIFI